MSLATRKTDCPIMYPITIAVAARRPRPRIKPESLHASLGSIRKTRSTLYNDNPFMKTAFRSLFLRQGPLLGAHRFARPRPHHRHKTGDRARRNYLSLNPV